LAGGGDDDGVLDKYGSCMGGIAGVQICDLRNQAVVGGKSCCGVGYMVGEDRSMRDSVRAAEFMM
jgi:hypothetical protein